MARKKREKSIKDIYAQRYRIAQAAEDVYQRSLRNGDTQGAEHAKNRYMNAARIARKYETNIIKAQTKGLTEEQLNQGRGSKYDKKMSYSARAGISG